MFWRESPRIWKQCLIRVMNNDIMLMGVLAGIYHCPYCKSSSGAIRFGVLVEIFPHSDT